MIELNDEALAYARAHETIKNEWSNSRKELVRRSWDHNHMSMAWEASERSPDAQTKVGAFLTNLDHEPISAGYNGFPRNAKDNIMPNLRPDKYKWMIHAEVNAILNAARQGVSTKDTVLYCTHRPCLNCMMMVWQAGCREIVFDLNSSTNMSNNFETETDLALFDLAIGGTITVRGINFQK